MPNELASAPRPRVLITGANGFVGRYLIDEFAKYGWEIRAVVRSLRTCNFDKAKVCEIVEVPDFAAGVDWAPVVSGCTVVAHLAARAHQVLETQGGNAEEYFRVNVAATASLALHAANAKVHRFIFVSSSGVMGETSKTPWTEGDVPNPQSSYSVSKLMAEEEVQKLALKNQMEYVILRPALIYGPGNPGNLARLLKLVDTRLPLPFKGVTAKRSMVGVSYFVQILVIASTLRGAANQTYLVSDGQDFVLPDIVRAFAEGFSISPRLFHCPVNVLSYFARIFGRESDLRKLTSDFQIDARKLRRDFGVPSYLGARDSLVATAKKFLTESQR